MQISLFNILIAFAGGLLSFLSPCVLPLVPGYISLMSGVSIDHLKGEGGSRSVARRAVIINSIAFNVGLSVIFLALGATAGLVGSAVISNPWVRIIGGLVIIVFGLHLIGLLKIKYLYRHTRQFSSEKPRTVLRSLTLPTAFSPPATTTPPAVNASFPLAPEVEFQTLDGQPFRLASLRGKVVLLNFWATWCIPCRAEIPEFNTMQRDLQARGFSIVGASVSPVDTAEAIRGFQKDVKQDYTVIPAAEEIGAKFGNGPGLPVTYLIDRAGRIRQKFIGQTSRENFEAALKPLLDEAPATAQRND